MHDTVTTALDALGLLLIAAGIGGWLYVWWGDGEHAARWLALTVAGVVVVVGSALATLAQRAGRAAP